MRTAPIFAALIRRDWQIAISYRASFVLELGSIILSLALFFYLGSLVDDSELAAKDGIGGDYFAYAAVGIVLMQVVTLSLSSFTRKLREEQTTGTLEALMTTPISPALLVVASSSYDLVRATLSGMVMLIAAIVIFGLDLDTGGGALAVAALALLGCLGLVLCLVAAVAAFTVVLKRATALLGLTITAIALLCGVYFPIEVLPDPLEAIAKVLPFTWGLDVMRSALLGGDVDAVQLAGVFAAVAVLVPASLAAFTAAVRRARRAGTLAEY